MSKTIIVKRKKSPRVKLKQNIQQEFNRMIAKGQPCAKCGQTFPVMQCSHIKTIGAYPNLRFDVMNALPMCGRHHMFWWHAEPTESGIWLQKNYPGRYQYLQQAKNKIVKYTIEDLKQIRIWIHNRNLRKLVIAPELIGS